MSPRRIASVATTCLLAAACPAAGFAPVRSSRRSTAPATVALAASHASEDVYPRLLANASLCANSESCSIESAEAYLKEIIHVQSGCAAGTFSGNDVCEDVLSVSEVVANLRRKIGEGAKREVRTFWDQRQDELQVLASASQDGSLAALTRAPLKPAYLAIAALYTVAVVSILQSNASLDVTPVGGVVPFTAQEVWWAMRDGYLGDLAGHMFRNGGLVVSDSMTGVVGDALSPQELFWSIRDGYVGDTLFNPSGGVADIGAESNVVPFTPQEVWWAITNGYSFDMVSHWFRNGGLSV